MNVAKMLGALAGIGAAPELLTVLREFAQDGGAVRELNADDRRYLDGPVVVHESPWRDTLPEWMHSQARAERAEIVLGDSKWIVGPTEMAAVMYPRTFESPMRSEMADLYLWASTQAAAKHFGRDLAAMWKQVGGREITDREVLEPGGRLYYEYRDLAHEIRRKVIAALKAREPNGAARVAKVNPEMERPDAAGLIQMSLYLGLAA